MSNLRYRPEIDGLRALAVIGVVLYHIGLGFPGGYVGVDVFFVISGYLITGIIIKDLRKGTFSMLDFWVRRIRRILPAVYVMIIASLILGYFILPSLKPITESSMASSLMASNIYFWRDSGYFAAGSDMKPLLHTWSLAVEEQFYVIFPLVLYVLWRFRKRHALAIVCLIGIFSLLLSCWATVYKPGANFYLLPTRAWELIVGACLALGLFQRESRPVTNEIVSWLGILMIFAAMFCYDHITPFPGWMAIPPVVGSAMFIWANREAPTMIGKFFSMRPVVFMGLISYSFYLWHWPLLVFAKRTIIDVDLSWKITLLLSSFLISVASWKFIETPFRREGVLSKRKPAFTFGVLSTCGILLISFSGMKFGGLIDRFQDGLAPLRADMGLQPVRSRFGKGGILGSIPAEDPLDKKPSFYIWGDSHGMVMHHVMHECAQRNGLHGVAHYGASRIPVIGLKQDNNKDNIIEGEKVFRTILDSGTKNLIIIARWAGYLDGDIAIEKPDDFFAVGLMERGDNVSQLTPDKSVRLLSKYLGIMARKLQSHGVTLWVVKQVPETTVWGRHFYLWKKYPYLNNAPAQYTTSREEHQVRQRNANAAFDAMTGGVVNLVDPATHFFKNGDRLKAYQDRAYYCDSHHLTRAGADYYLKDMLSELFAQIAAQEKGASESLED
jgi:peptidoglycan/LPS O-acetylase OafA/YrhL